MRLCLMGALLLMCAASVLPSYAQGPDPATSNAPALAVGANPDVRLVIDVSGSMKRNDPNNLRQPAVELLVRLLPEGSKAGVWTFGKFVNMLIPHQPVNESWREAARGKASAINSVGLFTNIGEALERAAYDADGAHEGQAKSIILLTDGMVDVDKDPAKNQAEWRRIVDEVLPKLKAGGFKVHTIALSNNADKDLMQKLAVATDGVAAVANSAEDLLKVFLVAFDVAAPAQQLPLVNNTFVVDSSVEEFTALIFRQVAGEDTQVIGPDEQVISRAQKPPDVNWYHTEQYDLITIKQPLEGEWHIKAAIAPDSRVTVVSDLVLRVRALPNNAFLGSRETLSFALLEEGETVTRPEFLRLLANAARLGYGAGEAITRQIWQYDLSQYEPPANGIYAVELPVFEELGTYELQVMVDGKTFKREFSHRVTVREPFTAEITETTDAAGQMQHLLTVRSYGEDIVLNKTQLAAAVTNPKRRKVVKPLVLTEFDHWQVPLALDMSGSYDIRVEVAGVDAKGQPFEYQLQPIVLDHQPDQLFAQAAPAQPAQAEPPAPPEEPAAAPQTAPQSGAEAAAEQEPEPAQDVAPPVAQAASGDAFVLPKWVYYALLGVANLVLLGGGYWLFKKLTRDPEADVLEDTLPPLIEDEPQAEPQAQPEEEAAALSMDDAGVDDEEPPMEDLDDFDAAPDNEVEEEPQMLTEEASGEDEGDDFGVDDLEEELMQQMASEASVEEKQSFAQEMLKAQGLDMPEDEMDDAIANLIGELDGDPPVEPSGNDDFDDFDFGLDDKDK